MADFDVVEETKKAKAAGLEIYDEGSADLKDFIKETLQQARASFDKREQADREQRAADREAAKEQADREAAKEQADRQAAKEQADRDHQMALAKLAAENKKEETPAVAADMGKDLFKVGKFDPNKEDFETYIKGFEKMVNSRKLPEDQWSSVLRMHVEGEVAAEMDRMEDEDFNVYKTVKELLMQRYRLTEEGYRWRFRNTRPNRDQNERPEQFITKIKGFLNNWIELSGIEKDYQGLFNLILREQFLKRCPKEMVTYLKEHKCKDMEKVKESSIHYTQIHGLKAFHGQNGNYNSMFRGQQHNRNNSNNSNDNQQPQNNRKPETSNWKSRGPPSSPEKRRRHSSYKRDDLYHQGESGRFECFECGSTEHKIASCPQKKKRIRERREHAAALRVKEKKVEKTKTTEIPKKPTAPPGMRVNLKWVFEEEGQGHAGACMEVSDPGERSPAEHTSVLPRLSMAYEEINAMTHKMPVMSGRLMPANTPISVLRDTGCSTCVIRSNLVNMEQQTGRNQTVILIDGTEKRYPVARIKIDSPYFVGETDALCIPNSISEVVIGNVKGARDACNPDYQWKPTPSKEDEVQNQRQKVTQSRAEADRQEEAATEEQSAAMETRAQTQRGTKESKPLKVAPTIPMVTPKQLEEDQRKDEGLKHLWDKARNEDEGRTKYMFIEDDGCLYRQERDPNNPKEGKGHKLLVIPHKHREKIIKTAHDSLISGHMGINNTISKIMTQFFWPGLAGDVSRFCRSCDICQKTIDKGRVPKAPLGKMPIMEVPFQRIAIDLIGPIQPPSGRGHRWILTVVDYATRYPEAIPLKQTATIDIAEALLAIYSRVGFPYEILSDLGTNFISELMREVERLISVKHKTTTRYHPQCNGLCEKYNGLIKKILRRMCKEQPKEWDRYLPALLFALRETPNSSLGFSPFELLYGRDVRGPMKIIRELWTNRRLDSDEQDEYHYITELRERLAETWKLAQETLAGNAEKYKKHFDKKAKPRKLKADDKVLVLLPTDNNKLLLHWKGPYIVKEKKHENDYVISMEGTEKLYHINMLKRYYERGDPPVAVAGHFEQVTDEEDQGIQAEDYEADDFAEDGIIELPSTEQKQFINDVDINPNLTEYQAKEIKKILYTFQDIFTDVPKKTTAAECRIDLTTTVPVRSRPYMVPQSVRAVIRKEIDEMLKLGVIEESTSPYGQPIVMVKKNDGTNRFCIDFRKLNKVTVFNPEPMPNPQDLFAQLTGSIYFTKFDLTKGYWQMPVRKEDQEKTAFVTPDGRYEFKYMPFGLVTAGAQFTCMMRTVLKGISNVVNYIDDTLIHSKTWEEHTRTVELVLRRIRKANLAIKPKKCLVGYNSVEFLGHIVGGETTTTNPELIRKISEAPRPITKKQVRSFLGLTGFYRNYIENYASKAMYLTMLTGKGMPDKVKWGEEQEKSFETLKGCLAKAPILHLPDFNKTFQLHVDASDWALGSALMQEFDGKLFPIAYASKKLLPRERNYATVEKECLAIVWAVNKFEYFLFGKNFEIHTDHQPLIYLDAKKTANRRLMRWAMLLQSYRFRLVSIKGSDNLAADYLSRSTTM